MLDDLVSVIKTLQQRIRDHGPTLRAKRNPHSHGVDRPVAYSFWVGMYPIPSLVTPEYRVDVGWADYALAGPR